MSKVNYPNAVRQIPVHEHGSREWLIERANTLGASEIGKALGVSPYGGLLSLVIDKRQARAGNPEVITSDAMQDGQDAEDTVLRMAWRRLRLRKTTSTSVSVRTGALRVSSIQRTVPWRTAISVCEKTQSAPLPLCVSTAASGSPAIQSRPSSVRRTSSSGASM
jgi:predicted phage-related endonuclease